MAQYAGDSRDELMALITDLQRRIRSLETSAPLRNASISDGGQLAVNDRDGSNLILIGRTDDPSRKAPDGQPQMVFYLSRSTGEIALSLEDPLPAVDGFHQFLALWDRSGNVIMGDDTTSGKGLARPYVPIPFYPYPAAPIQTTTSGSFTTLMRAAAAFHQHPRVQVGVLVQSSASTTGEVRLYDSTNGVQVGSTLTIPGGDFSNYMLGPAALGGNHMDTLDLDVQARRLTGAGTIGVQVTTAYGVQS